MKVCFLHKLLDNGIELVTPIQTSIYLGQIHHLAITILMHEVGENILHVVREPLNICLEGITDMVGSVQELLQRQTRHIEERDAILLHQ